jgi:hypothetical protein
MNEMRCSSPDDPVRGTVIRRSRCVPTALMAFLAAFLLSSPAAALSEIPNDDPPPSAEQPADDGVTPRIPLPPVDPLLTSPPPSEPEDDGETEAEDAAGADDPIPEIQYDLMALPEPVRRMRELLVEACRTGDVESVRPLLETGQEPTTLSFGGVEGDPIEFLKSLAGDEEGQEILAIMEEVLSAGYVHLGSGTADDLYVWPYFFSIPLEKLDKRQRVELFKIITSGEYEEMKAYGAYIFYRVGITPEGRWAFFVAGD